MQVEAGLWLAVTSSVVGHYLETVEEDEIVAVGMAEFVDEFCERLELVVCERVFGSAESDHFHKTGDLC